MDIGKSLAFVFEDERWLTKYAIAVGIQLLGLVGIIVLVGPVIATALLLGYTVAIARNVRRGVASPLPEWDDWGGLFFDGLKVLLALLVWSLPLMIVFAPAMLLNAVLGGSDGGDVVPAILSLCLSCISGLWSIVYAFVTPVIIARVAATGELGEALNPARVLAFARDHLAEVIIVAIVTLVVQLLAGIVGLLLCIVGVMLTAPWPYMVQGYLCGRLGREHDEWGDSRFEAPPAAPVDRAPAAGGVPTDLPDPEQMVDQVQDRAEDALDEWSSQTVRLDDPAPASEPLRWEAPGVPEDPAAPSGAPGEPPTGDAPTAPI